MPHVSVILCTHNPRFDYLRRALDALKAQTLPSEQWVLLLIDNASKERLAEAWDISWHPQARHVREDELGLTPARLRGIQESCGELLVFIDDDNVVAPDFLDKAVTIAARYPNFGVFGAGTLEPEFEAQPAPELIPLLPFLALRSVSLPIWSNNVKDTGCIPWGAGLCVTRRTANHYPELVHQLNVSKVLGRRGQRLFCGEDDLFSWAAVIGGQGFGLFPELRVTHLIPAQRLNRSHMLRLIRDHYLSHAVLNYLLAGTQPRRIIPLRYVRLLLHGIKNGKFSMRCQWAALRGEDHAARFIPENGLRSLNLCEVIPEILQVPIGLASKGIEKREDGVPFR